MGLVNCKGWSVHTCLPRPSCIPSSFIFPLSSFLRTQNRLWTILYVPFYLPPSSLSHSLPYSSLIPPFTIPPSPSSSFHRLFLILPFPLSSPPPPPCPPFLSSSHSHPLFPPPTEPNHLSLGVQHGESFPASGPLQSLRECHHHPDHRAGHASLVLLLPLELQTVRTGKLMASHQSTSARFITN